MSQYYRHCLIDRWCCIKIYFRAIKNIIPKIKKLLLYILLPHQHVSMVTMCLVMETGPWIWTFPHKSIYCAYTLFHFLTSTFFPSHRNTFHSPTYLTFLSLSLCLSHTPTLSLSLSARLSVCLSQCKRLVSRQVLRPIKLSTSLVDLKDTNTQSALGQRTQRLTQTHSCTLKDTDDNSNAPSDFTPTHAGRETCSSTHTSERQQANQTNSFTQGL